MVRKEGVEPSRELPHRNLNCDLGELSAGNSADSVRQATSRNAARRQLSGRAGPVLDLLNEARRDWTTGASPRSLRRTLLEIFQLLDGEDET